MWDLGVLYGQDVPFNPHKKQAFRNFLFHLFNNSKLRNILSQCDAEKLIHTFVTRRLDYCDPLLGGCPQFMLIQHAAVGVLTRISRIDHTSLLVTLHWFPEKSRTEFRINLLTYKALQGPAL